MFSDLFNAFVLFVDFIVGSPKEDDQRHAEIQTISGESEGVLLKPFFSLFVL